jgi:hypothetical protein
MTRNANLMLLVNDFKVTKVGAVPGGHIVLVDIGGSRFAALRISDPRGGEPWQNAILILNHGDYPNAAGPLAIAGQGEVECIDVGKAIASADGASLTTDPPRDNIGLGHLVIGRNGPSIAGSLGNATGRARWLIQHGTPDTGDSLFRFDTWRIGVRQPDIGFVPIAEFPQLAKQPGA